MRKLFIVILICSGFFKINAQKDINNYKYVVIPLQYEFLKGKNPYRLSTLSKVLFNQYGYKAFFEEENLPDDLFKNRCKAMYANINEGKGGFRITKLEIELRDCKGELLFKSEIGKSGINNHEKRYQTALRKAFESLKSITYSYNPNQELGDEPSDKVKVDQGNEIVTEKEIMVNDSVKQTLESQKEDVATKKVDKVFDSNISENGNKDVLKAIKTPVGYNLIDENAKIIYTLIKTSANDIFVVKGKDAIVMKKNGKWLYSENDGNNVKEKVLYLEF